MNGVLPLDRFSVTRLAARGAIVALALGVSSPLRAQLTTESPEVKQCVARGIAFLEDAGGDGRLGAVALRGLALIKNGAPADHPIVVDAAQTVAAEARNELVQTDIYSLGLSVIFLCSLDSDKYRDEVERLLVDLGKTQKEHGGWGYENRETGDTSMTQYAVLAMWEAEQVGFRPPLDSWERVANWLLRTQAAEGAFGYQGNDPGNFSPAPQTEIRPSMAAAGTGSLYICSDRLGMVKLKTVDEGVPAALKPVDDAPEGDPTVRTRKVDPQRMAGGRERGDRWLLANYTVKPELWVYYYLYAYERYQSFREAASDKKQADPPQWYDEGARFLIGSQEEDGSWVEQAGDVPDTAFAVLFLLRSTRKSIERAKTYGAGTLVGGRGLPQDTADVRLRLGKIVARPLSGPAEDLFKIMADPKHNDYLRAVESLEDLTLEGDVDALAVQSDRLLQLAQQGSPEARAAAVKALARLRSLDHVPALIKALEDPDLIVFQEARDGLRFVSRKLRGFGLSSQPTDAELKVAIEKWRAWYLEVRPGSPLID